MRIGIDIGGTKISGVALGDDGVTLANYITRVPNDYNQMLFQISHIASLLEINSQSKSRSIGISMAGEIDQTGSIIKSVNLPWCTGKSMLSDLENIIVDKPIAISNDADCFALSESFDGAATRFNLVFGVVIGTGVGGAIVADGRIINGHHAINGEWGHTPLPWKNSDEGQIQSCYCGKLDCIETWINGSALSRDYVLFSGEEADPPTIVKRSLEGQHFANIVIQRYHHRLARALSLIIKTLNPEVIVIGGGLSEIVSIFEEVPLLIKELLQLENSATKIVRAKHGPNSGMRGAARLI